MEIRKAYATDAPVIKELLEQLGYPTAEGFLEKRLEDLSSHPDHTDVVFVGENKVLGFLSMHFIPQIAFDASYAVISYLVVEETSRSFGIGKKLEDYADERAREKGCRRLFLHSNIKRTDAHRFYLKQGYQEYNKAFVKYLIP